MPVSLLWSFRRASPTAPVPKAPCRRPWPARGRSIEAVC